jgi:hypothetical protein
MAIALRENRAINGMEAAAERPDGTRVPFMAFPSPLRDAAGKVVGGVNMLVDISERKCAEEVAQQFASMEAHMAPLFFTCPTTRQQAPTGIETDAQSLRAVWSKRLEVHCPLCGGLHEISVRETYIEGALHDAADGLRLSSKVAAQAGGRDEATANAVRVGD